MSLMHLPAVFRRLVAAFSCATALRAAGWLLAGVLAAGTAAARPAGEAPGARPEPRLEQLQRMGPAERREAWRRMSPDERAAVRNQIPPERRGELLQRSQESRERLGDGNSLDGGPRRLSPEERQRLRDQINETNRDLRWKGARRHEQQRKGRNR